MAKRRVKNAVRKAFREGNTADIAAEDLALLKEEDHPEKEQNRTEPKKAKTKAKAKAKQKEE